MKRIRHATPALSREQRRLAQVTQVLDQVLKFRFPADAVLSHWFKAQRQLGARDRAEVAESIFDILRHLRRYRHYADSGVGPHHERLAILGLAHTVGVETLRPHLDDVRQAWLDRVLAIDPTTLPEALRYSVPDAWLPWFQHVPQSSALLGALQEKAPLDIRVNPLKSDRERLWQTLQNQGLLQAQDQRTPYSPFGIRLWHKPALQRWPAFEQGWLEVQDEGSQLLCMLVSPRRSDMLIDFCAGAGGKTLLLGAMMHSQGRVYAFDVSEKRLAKAKPRLARSGLSNVTCVPIASENDARVKRLAGKAHKVLVDAPCSGTGTWRRNPDLKWRQTPEALSELLPLQKRILHSAARCVMPGGRLIYSTCSVLPQENELQIQAFLQEHPDFQLLPIAQVLGDRNPGLHSEDGYLRLRPDQHGTDGFFAAVLERQRP